MNINDLINLINTITAGAAQLIAKLISTSGFTVEEIRAERDKLSANTHELVDAELAKLEA